MKTATFAELAAMPDGTIFEYYDDPHRFAQGLLRKVPAFPFAALLDINADGICYINISCAIEKWGEFDAGLDFLPRSDGQGYQFHVYKPVDMYRLGALIGRETS